MTPLEQKLQQLSLKAMSRQVEATIAEAAARNLSVSATLELLTDMELEARHGRAIGVASSAHACNRSPASTPSTSTITKAACRLRTASFVCSTLPS